MINDAEPCTSASFPYRRLPGILGGYGGIQHCLVPAPSVCWYHNEDGEITTQLFAPEQTSDSMMRLLGYSHSTPARKIKSTCVWQMLLLS